MSHQAGLALAMRESVNGHGAHHSTPGPWYRLAQRAAAPGGSGLGLAIASELAERWDGELRVATAPEGGTVVEVSLRLADERDGGP